MAESGAVASVENIEAGYAQSAAELYGNKPFHGSLLRDNGQETPFMQYIPVSERLTLREWLEHKGISRGRFILETTDKAGNENRINFAIDKDGESKPQNPFRANMPSTANGQHNESSSILNETLKAEVIRLKGNLEDETRQRKDAENDLFKARKQLSDDNSAKAIAHKDAIDAIKDDYRGQMDDLKTQLSESKQEIKILELETRLENGGISGWERFFKFLDSKLSEDFLSGIADNLGKLANQGGQQRQISAAQVQQAIAQAHAAQQQQPGVNRESSNVNSGESRPNSNEEEKQEPTALNKQQMKQEFVNGLKTAAFEALVADNANLEQYGNAMRSQMALNKQRGISLTAGEWVNMAKMLAEKAVQDEISEQRVAAVIEPLLAGVPKTYRAMLSMLNAKMAAEKLFSTFNIEASKPVKKVVVNVLKALKNS